MHSEKERKALERSWAITCRHLAAGKQRLAGKKGLRKALRQYRSFLDHNELELALDELESTGEQRGGDRLFWQALLDAAQNMGLADHAARYRGKIEERLQ